MQNLGNNLRFTISVQITIVADIVIVLGGIVVSSVVAISRVGWASSLIVAGGRPTAVGAVPAGAELYWVPGTCAAKRTALVVLF